MDLKEIELEDRFLDCLFTHNLTCQKFIDDPIFKEKIQNICPSYPKQRLCLPAEKLKNMSNTQFVTEIRNRMHFSIYYYYLKLVEIYYFDCIQKGKIKKFKKHFAKLGLKTDDDFSLSTTPLTSDISIIKYIAYENKYKQINFPEMMTKYYKILIKFFVQNERSKYNSNLKSFFEYQRNVLICLIKVRYSSNKTSTNNISEKFSYILEKLYYPDPNTNNLSFYILALQLRKSKEEASDSKCTLPKTDSDTPERMIRDYTKRIKEKTNQILAPIKNKTSIELQNFHLTTLELENLIYQQIKESNSCWFPEPPPKSKRKYVRRDKKNKKIKKS